MRRNAVLAPALCRRTLMALGIPEVHVSRTVKFLRALLSCSTMLAIATTADASADAWRLISSTLAFPPVFDAPLGTYDAAQKRVLVLDGGDIATRYDMTVWSFSPAKTPHWNVLPVSGPVPRQLYLPGVAMDMLRNRLLVVGMDLSDIRQVAVWALDLSGVSSWHRLDSATGPSARYGHSAMYDAAHDRLVVFGGELDHGPTQYSSETWFFSLTTNTWAPVSKDAAAPEPREGQGTLYDPLLHRMLMFGGHSETGGRHFFNDLWAFSLDSLAWQKLEPEGAVPGARSSFGTLYDPVRRRMLVHGGVLADSGTEPDELWALALDGDPVWTKVVPANTLHGRSYPVDIYDPAADRLLSCTGSGSPQASALSLALPALWSAVDPPSPLQSPGAHDGSSVVFDARRDRFLVVGGAYSVLDSATWQFTLRGQPRWEPIRTPAAPYYVEHHGSVDAIVADARGDRILLFDGRQVFEESAERPGGWTALGQAVPLDWSVGQDGAIAIDTRRNRLIVSGGWVFPGHNAGFSMRGMWALDLGAHPAWTQLGELPRTAYGHGLWYDAALDRLIMLGGDEIYDLGRFRYRHGARVWTLSMGDRAQWRSVGLLSDSTMAGPPNAYAAYDERGERLFLGIDSTLWTRGVDDAGMWKPVELTGRRPLLANALAIDPKRNELVALFAPLAGSDRVNAWSLPIGGRREFASWRDLGPQRAGATSALELGASPSPASGAVRLSLRLPGTGTATLEVFDLAGRRTFASEVGALGEGSHALTIPGSERWDAGVYFARLQRGGAQRALRFVFIP